MRIHGGNPPPGVIDFSSPQNPLPPPDWIREEIKNCISDKVYSRYYDPELSTVKDAVSRLEGIKLPIHVANGSAEILATLPLLLRPSILVVLEPNFGDHKLQSKASGVRLKRIPLKLGRNHIDVDEDAIHDLPRRPLVVLSRPNNPTGMSIDARRLKSIQEILEDKDGWLVVDEAFQQISDIEPYRPNGNIIIVKTLTKALSTPGLRMGYAYSQDEDLIQRLEAARQPWPLDSITHCIYQAMHDRIGEARRHIEEGRRVASIQRSLLSRRLSDTGLEVYKSDTVYMLVRHACLPHPRLNKMLLHYGVYVRDASSFYSLDSRFSRISVKLEPENRILADAVRKVMQDCRVQRGWG